MKNVRFLGLDVHAQTISVAVAEPGGEVRSLGMIPNGVESVRKLVVSAAPGATSARGNNGLDGQVSEVGPGAAF